MPNVILTRTLEENKRLAPIISDMGFTPIYLPMLEQKDLGVDINLYSEYEYLVVTSKFAAKIVSEKLAFEAKIYVVGKESARILSGNRFVEIVGVYKNISELNKVLPRGMVIYFCGGHITKSLPVRTIQIYETIYFTDHLNSTASLDNILLFSELSAEHFLLFIKNHNLLRELKKSVIVCISSKVAKKFENLAEVYFVSEPDEEAMLELLKKHGRR
jgi:uroporphyrinogen-III synthase